MFSGLEAPAFTRNGTHTFSPSTHVTSPQPPLLPAALSKGWIALLFSGRHVGLGSGIIDWPDCRLLDGYLRAKRGYGVQDEMDVICVQVQATLYLRIMSGTGK